MVTRPELSGVAGEAGAGVLKAAAGFSGTWGGGAAGSGTAAILGSVWQPVINKSRAENRVIDFMVITMGRLVVLG